jgi:UDP-N-acetylmuramyl pentapeptide phosphotransferase/UDP-N-acetylglucosamine-1-phosphate transferase
MNALVANSVWAFVLALLLSLILMPVSVILGARYGLLVTPRLWRRGRSKRAVTYLGGPAVCLATVAGSFFSSRLPIEFMLILAGGTAMLLLSFRDNKRRRSRRLHPLLRVLLQTFIAGAVWWLVFRDLMPDPLEGALAIIWLVVAANSFNLLDNMDGVAGSTAAATAAGFTVLAFMSGEPQLAVPMAALCGACLGFLPHNAKRARVYLGAGGPEFIGFLLGAAALQVSARFGGSERWITAAAVLAVPLTDTTITLWARMAVGDPLAKGNVDHISHKLARLGLRTLTIAVIHGVMALAAAVAVAMAFKGTPQLSFWILAVYGVLGILLAIIVEHNVRLRSGLWRWLRYAALAVIALGLLAVPPTVGAALDLRKSKAAFTSGLASAKAFDVAGARASFAAGGELAAAAERKLDMPLTLVARYMPIIGDNLRAVSALAKGGRMIGPAAEEALKAAEIFPTGPNGLEIGFSEGRINIDPWPVAVERLARAAVSARNALEQVQATDGLLVPPIANARNEFIERGTDAARTLDTAGDAAALIPHVFGAEKPRTWFLAIQNPSELRATGGFLGAFGILRGESGKLTLERFDADNALPELSTPAPAPQEFADNYDRFYSRTFWFNTNMTPDFPTVAEVLANMWEHATKTKIDGVIAIDAVGLNQLLKLVGPVNAPPVGQITHDNFLPLALNEAYVRFPEKEARSSFLLEVGREVWSRLLAGNFSNPSALLEPLGDMVGTKRLQMWSREQQDRIMRLGVAGDLHPDDGSDYLMVVGQNSGGNKLDYYARRRISYKVDLTNPRDVRGAVDVAIENGAPSSGLPPYIIGPYDLKDPPGLNRTFTSVYLPGYTGILRSTVDGRQVQVESKSEKGLLAASQFQEVLSGKTSTLSLQTAGIIARPGLYRLLVQHQPNLNPDFLEIDIELPDDTVISEVTPGMKIKDNHVTWSGKLDSQKEFLVRYAVTNLGR